MESNDTKKKQQPKRQEKKEQLASKNQKLGFYVLKQKMNLKRLKEM